MMNVLAKPGSGVTTGTSTSGSATGSVSGCSPDVRHSPDFDVSTPSFSALSTGVGSSGTGSAFLRGAISPPGRRPSSADIPVGKRLERSGDSASSSPSTAAPGSCSRSTSAGNISAYTPSVIGGGSLENDDLNTDNTKTAVVSAASSAHSRESSLETTASTNAAVFALDDSEVLGGVDAAVRVGRGLVFSSGLSSSQSAWAAALSGDVDDVAVASGAPAVSV